MGDLRLIRTLFWLLAATVGAAVALCTFLPINDVVRVPRGEILADRPRTVYRAPYDVQVESTFVTEGARVRKGEVLVLLANTSVTSELAQATAERDALRDEGAIVARQEANAAERAAAIQRQLDAARERLALTASDSRSGESFLAVQVQHAAERLVLAQTAHERSKVLLDRAMLTRPEFEQTRRAVVDAQAGVDEARRRLDEQRTARARLGPDARAELARLESELLTTRATRLALEERLQRLAHNVDKQEAAIVSQRATAARRRVVAETDGTVRAVFNIKAQSNLVRAGEVLADVAPLSVRDSGLYAKLLPSQAAVRRLRVGQRARLKVDSYHYYRYGPLRGTVRYVSPPDDSSGYYVLVDLDARPSLAMRPGYTVRGEIVVARMPLFQLLVRRVFDKLPV